MYHIFHVARSDSTEPHSAAFNLTVCVSHIPEPSPDTLVQYVCSTGDAVMACIVGPSPQLGMSCTRCTARGVLLLSATMEPRISDCVLKGARFGQGVPLWAVGLSPWKHSMGAGSRDNCAWGKHYLCDARWVRILLGGGWGPWSPPKFSGGGGREKGLQGSHPPPPQ